MSPVRLVNFTFLNSLWMYYGLDVALPLYFGLVTAEKVVVLSLAL